MFIIFYVVYVIDYFFYRFDVFNCYRNHSVLGCNWSSSKANIYSAFFYTIFFFSRPLWYSFGHPNSLLLFYSHVRTSQQFNYLHSVRSSYVFLLTVDPNNKSILTVSILFRFFLIAAAFYLFFLNCEYNIISLNFKLSGTLIAVFPQSYFYMKSWIALVCFFVF